MTLYLGALTYSAYVLVNTRTAIAVFVFGLISLLSVRRLLWRRVFRLFTYCGSKLISP